jgi:hypothetical protein
LREPGSAGSRLPREGDSRPLEDAVTVYVAEAPRPFGTGVFMVADTETRLHALAAQIGVGRDRFENDRYRLSTLERGRALRLGARAVTTAQFAAMILSRGGGYAMGIAETAEAIAAERATARPGGLKHLILKAVAALLPGAAFRSRPAD